MNSKKIIISTLALAMGSALAGSISGSVAWYQYSTRAAAIINGTSAGTSRDLLIREKTDGDTETFAHSVTFENADYTPVTPKTIESNAVTAFSGHPVYQYATFPDAGANDKYLEKTFEFQLTDTTKSGSSVVTKNLYLTKLNITSANIAPLIRVAVAGESGKYIFSAAGGTTTTSGNLDIGGDTGADRDAIDEKDTTGNLITYTSGSGSYSSTAASAVAAFTDAYTPGSALQVGTTAQTVKVQVWLEGWATLADNKNAWELASTLNKTFSVEMRFEVAAEA